MKQYSNEEMVKKFGVPNQSGTYLAYAKIPFPANHCLGSQSDSIKYPYVPFRYHINSDGNRFPLSCRITYFNDVGVDIAALIIRPIKLPEGIDKDRRKDPILCND